MLLQTGQTWSQAWSDQELIGLFDLVPSMVNPKASD